MQVLTKEMENSESGNPLTNKKAVHTRWLSHERAVHTVRQCYPAILADLENAVGMGNDKRAGDKRMKRMKEKPGPYLSKVDQLTSQYGIDMTMSRQLNAQSSKGTFLDLLIGNVKDRLQATPVLTSLSALDLRKAGDSSFLTFHGDAEVSDLAEQFQLDTDQTLLEWNQVKELFSNDLDTSSPAAMLKTLTSLKPQLGNLYTCIVKLLSVYATVILSTSEVERVFSRVKLIVTDHRNRLSVKNCNRLLMISMNTSSSADIDLDKVVAKFLSRKNRRI